MVVFNTFLQSLFLDFIQNEFNNLSFLSIELIYFILLLLQSTTSEFEVQPDY